MAANTSSAKPSLGFLTVVRHAQHGLFGGYLVVNLAGRPLEFHCTAPIKPNRAQEILYGAALGPYLYGEQIGQTLFSKAKNNPLVVCTDREAALALREHVDVPVALVLSEESREDRSEAARSEGSRGRVWRVDGPHGSLRQFALGCNRLAVLPEGQDETLVSERLAEIAQTVDLAEPFDRIREAIREARRGG